MFDEKKLRSAVARELKAFVCERENQADKRGIESAPYARHASPMARYQPMIRLLCDTDYECLNLPFLAAVKHRSERRRIYLGYVAELRKEAMGLLSLQAQSGAADRAETQRDYNAIQSALRRLVLAAWMHRLHLPGLSDRVANELRGVTHLLQFGHLVQMPTPAPQAF